MINKQIAMRDEKRKYIKCRISDEMHRQLILLSAKTGLCISDITRLGLISEIERMKGRYNNNVGEEESFAESIKRQAHESALARYKAGEL